MKILRKESKHLSKIDSNPALANSLMATGLLVEGALLESMLQSKALTAIVIVGTLIKLGLIYSLFL